jgi:hypothetical protein
MSTLLSLLGVVVFIIGTIAVAATVTWVVVRVSPSRTPQKSE